MHLQTWEYTLVIDLSSVLFQLLFWVTSWSFFMPLHLSNLEYILSESYSYGPFYFLFGISPCYHDFWNCICKLSFLLRVILNILVLIFLMCAHGYTLRSQNWTKKIIENKLIYWKHRSYIFISFFSNLNYLTRYDIYLFMHHKICCF